MEVNNNDKKEQCKCTKKIMVLEKEVRELKTKLDKQSKELETIKKSLKR